MTGSDASPLHPMPTKTSDDLDRSSRLLDFLRRHHGVLADLDAARHAVTRLEDVRRSMRRKLAAGSTAVTRDDLAGVARDLTSARRKLRAAQRRVDRLPPRP